MYKKLLNLAIILSISGIAYYTLKKNQHPNSITPQTGEIKEVKIEEENKVKESKVEVGSEDFEDFFFEYDDQCIKDFSEIKEDVENLVKDYIINNPHIIAEAMYKLEWKRLKEEKEKVENLIKQNLNVLYNTTFSPFIGQGEKTMIVYIDYGCGYCRKSNDSLNRVMSQNPNFKVIYKMYPILGEASDYLARVALAVYYTSPKKFEKVHNAFMNLSSVSKESVNEILIENEINPDNLEDVINGAIVNDEILRVKNFNIQAGIKGTPAFIFGSQFFPGALSDEKIKALVK